MFKVPTKWFFCAGTSEGESELNSFDNALCAAGVGNTNLLKLSSILPPKCQEIAPIRLPLGALIPIAYVAHTSGQSGQTIAAAVGIAFPDDPEKNGLIMEICGVGTREEYEERVRQMAISGFEARGYTLKDLRSNAVEYTVRSKPSTVFAGVVLWD